MGCIDSKVRRDPKGRILRSGEYYDEVKQRYKYRYRDAKGTYHDVYAFRLTDKDPVPYDKPEKYRVPLRELEKKVEEKMLRILFVCHGNICRSPMAEFVMKDLVRKAGLEDRFVIASKAARRDELGNDTHYGTKTKLRQMGVPFAKRRATLLDKTDYAAYDYLIAMDGENIRDMNRLFGGDPDKKIYKLLDFADEHRDVADPWYTGNFDATYEDVLKGCKGLLQTMSL